MLGTKHEVDKIQKMSEAGRRRLGASGKPPRASPMSRRLPLPMPRTAAERRAHPSSGSRFQLATAKRGSALA